MYGEQCAKGFSWVSEVTLNIDLRLVGQFLRTLVQVRIRDKGLGQAVS
jgi:hypothetical protein